jgi:DNA-damage-inducible protein D
VLSTPRGRKNEEGKLEGLKLMESDEGENRVPHASPFEAIRREAEDGSEYWSARDLAKILSYDNYRNFLKVIAKARIACEQSSQAVSDHFVETDEMVSIGSGAKRRVEDIYLSRYACYLVLQNADPNKPIVALGQTYFAVQTRRQELADQLAALPEDQKRLALRAEMSIYNSQLAEAALNAGIVETKDFAIFQDHGYQGLYGGLKAKDIHLRKGLKRNQHILDHMGSEELADNIFRAAQTDAKLRREQIQGKGKTNQTHYEVGKEVRDTIRRIGGTMPEDLPTPKESIQ